jgi:hypothetical protein
MPQISKSRDHSELQDMYRRALAASWASQPGELPADQCVEEIFAGGDGWKADAKIAPRGTQDRTNMSGEDLHMHRHHRTQSGASTKSQSTITGKGSGRFGHKHSRSKDTIDHVQSGPNETSSEGSERGRPGFRRANEVDELEMREDLMAWRLPGDVSS